MQLTGFLSTAAYGGLLTTADVVMTLTTRDHTMLRGAYEAIYQDAGRRIGLAHPARVLQRGCSACDNTPESIAAALRAVQACPAEFREGARRLRERKLAAWSDTRQAILDCIVA